MAKLGWTAPATTTNGKEKSIQQTNASETIVFIADYYSTPLRLFPSPYFGRGTQFTLFCYNHRTMVRHITTILLSFAILFGPRQNLVANDFSLRHLIDAPNILFKEKTPITLVGRITWSSGSRFLIDDASGSCFQIHNQTGSNPPPVGSQVRIACTTSIDERLYRYVSATNITLLGRSSAPSAVTATYRDVAEGKFDYRHIVISGVITDVFRDEIDNQFAWVVLRTKSGSIMASLSSNSLTNLDVSALVDADVNISGACIPRSSGLRQYVDRTVSIATPDDITIVTQAPQDPFAAKSLSEDLSPTANRPLHRRRINGHVLATWHGNQLFLLSDDQRRFKVVLADGEMIPAVGADICVVGFLDFDSFYPSFVRARLKRRSARLDVRKEPATALSNESPSGKHPLINPLLNGQAVRTCGTVCNISRSGPDARCLYLDDRGTLVIVEIGNLLPNLNETIIGCKLDVSGICLMRTEYPNSDTAFSRIIGLSIIPRDESDIRQLTHPPIWTPQRLSLVITALFVALIGALLWNHVLKRMVERRGRALFKSEIETASAELKTEERTRLAVELHDSISQNLTAISFQLGLVSRLVGSLVPKAIRPLDIASKTLQSCRDELRNCIWDLRNQALDEPTMDAALQKALLPHVAGVQLSIRFAVQRNRLSDNTAHTILQIVRELVANAVRHGHASRIRIAGTIDHDTLLFSVSDNGCGFDINAIPSARDGHFGLSGIQERIRHFDGKMKLVSTPGDTRISVALKLQQYQKGRLNVSEEDSHPRR